jgi:monofunctional glycosyltransferase
MNWFGKDAGSLTREESAAIAAILPNPRVYRANPPTRYVAARKAWILRQMGYWGNKLDYDNEELKEQEKNKGTQKRNS